MNMHPSIKGMRAIHVITRFTMLFSACVGAAMVRFQIRPMWLDEWSVVYNIKTKTATELWGQLDFMQQFPRVYLLIIQFFASSYDYSYSSLRLPAFITGLGVILLGYYLMKRMYDKQVFTRYLFVLMIISSFTFTEYFVQVKQYTMDILLSLYAIVQLIVLLQMAAGKNKGTVSYVLFCISCFIVPFFSYTYIIAISPAYIILLGQLVGNREKLKAKNVVKQLIPLACTTIGCVLFYILDLRQLGADSGMQKFWSTSMFDKHHMLFSFSTGFYRLFAQVGSGLLFENVFGILGVVSFIYSCIVSVRGYMRKEAQTVDKQLYTYSCLLIAMALTLFLLGKLPLGTGRLNVFTIPAIAILIINFINQFIQGSGRKMVLSVILYLGLIGNVFTSYNNYFSSDEYRQQMNIYNATENALALSEAKKIPLLISPAFGYPYQDAIALSGNPDAAAWMVKAFPAYKVKAHIPVYAIIDTTQVQQRMSHLSLNVTVVIAGDGFNFRVVERQQ